MGLVASASSRLIANTWAPAKAAVLERVVSRPVTIEPGQSIVSFTFDDVPLSALENGSPVLDEHDFKATFYVALGMARAEGRFLGEAHVTALANRGHHIGSHTLTHYSLRQGNPEGLLEDARAGVRALEPLVGTAAASHFAYPYGAVSARAKTLLQGEFASMRTSSRGVNAGRVDLSYLRAENLYSRGDGLDLEHVRRRVRSVERSGGWVIFYTHGVSDDPSEFDTSREDFRRAAEIVGQSGAQVLPVPDALASIRAARP